MEQQKTETAEQEVQIEIPEDFKRFLKRQTIRYLLGTNIKVLVNKPAVILFYNDEVYVSKAHNEDFDLEKGILMCLAKANGFTHSQIKKMCEHAQIQLTKEERKARKAEKHKQEEAKKAIKEDTKSETIKEDKPQTSATKKKRPGRKKKGE